MKIQTITEGQRVRSFDFDGRDLEGERACYVEGTVMGFDNIQGCDRYVIKVSKRVFGGEEVTPEDDTFIPPVNGTPTWMGGVTNCVEAM
jgi:hypothetical protein